MPAPPNAAIDEAFKAAAILANVNSTRFNVQEIISALGALKIKIEIDKLTQETNVQYSHKAYESAAAALDGIFARLPCAQEGIVVNLWQYCLLSMPDEPYNACRKLCALYSMLRVVLLGKALIGMDNTQLAETITVLMRRWAHSPDNIKNVLQALDDSGYNTPAHLAMLISP